MNHKYKKQCGFSTLEILIAFFILTISTTAVILIVFGNQSSSTSSQTNGEALYQAQHILEDARASSSHADFLDIVSVLPASVSNDIYNREIKVLDISPCAKQVTGVISWKEGIRSLGTSLSTLLTDPEEAILLGGDCLTTPPIGGWTKPNSLSSRDILPAGNQSTGIDVLNKIVYMTAGENGGAGNDDFFIIDAHNPIPSSNLTILGSGNYSAGGFNGIDVAKNPTDETLYAYIANNETSSQLQIIDVTTSSTPSLVATASFLGMTTGVGRSIFYDAQKVYVGTQYLPCVSCTPEKNNELQIYDVSSPNTPAWVASINVDRNVNAIIVRNGLAFIATGPGTAGTYNPLKIFDVNPSSPTYLQLIASFTASGDEEGTGLYLLGNTLYLGLERTTNCSSPPSCTTNSRPDFFVLDVGNLPMITKLGSINLSQNSNTKIADITVSGKYAFLALTDTTNGFQVLDISNPLNIKVLGKFNYSEEASGIDFENNFIYTSNKKNDALRIIRPAQCADTIDDDSDGKIDIADPQCHTDGNANNNLSYNPEDDSE